MPHLREAVFDPVLTVNAVEDVREGARVQGPVGELNAVVGQHGVDPIGQRLQQVAQELRRLYLACPLLRSQMRKLRRAVNGEKDIQQTLSRSNLGQIPSRQIASQSVGRQVNACIHRQAPAWQRI
jgi:hypothetical protein